jgi:hypothetical protein
VPWSKDVQEFQAIPKEEYGRELAAGEAGMLAQRLLLLYDVIYQKRLKEKPNSVEDALESHTAP